VPGIFTVVSLAGGLIGRRAADGTWFGILIMGSMAVLGSAATFAVGRAELHLALERVRRHSSSLRRPRTR
jgi:hypothetical protein